jgi:hypothetical protein
MAKRITYEFMKSEFEKEGYIYLDTEYKNSKSKMNYQCYEGHEHSIIWDSWKNGNRCPSCYGNTKPTFEHVKKSFDEENYSLLVNEYINSHIKLDYTCPNGHKHSIRWNNWQQGQRCPYCAGLVKLTVEYVRQSFEKEHYILLSEEYKGAFTKLNYTCPKGHNHSIKWNDWQQGYRCPYCAYINFSLNQTGNKNHQWKGGVSYEPYCPIWSDKEYKKDIKLRDDNKCLNPYCCSNKPNDLAIHHIDYNKKNCNPYNLITVCRSCNFKANTDREWHTAWYQALIYKRYLENKHAN